MGRWDQELIELLPQGVKVSASAGAGYDWVDVSCLAEHGSLNTIPFRRRSADGSEPSSLHALDDDHHADH